MTLLTQVILPLLLLASPFLTVFILVNKVNPDNLSYKFAMALALISAFLLIWVNLAVGIIGSEDNDANLMFVSILAFGLVGAIKVRFRSLGMSYVMLLLSVSHIVVACLDLIFQFGSKGPIWPFDVLGASLIFAILWFCSALLFRRSAQIQYFDEIRGIES